MNQDLTEHERNIAAQINVIGNAVLILIANTVWLVAFVLMSIISYLVSTDIIATLHIVAMLLFITIGLNATLLRKRWSVISEVKS